MSKQYVPPPFNIIARGLPVIKIWENFHYVSNKKLYQKNLNLFRHLISAPHHSNWFLMEDPPLTPDVKMKFFPVPCICLIDSVRKFRHLSEFLMIIQIEFLDHFWHNNFNKISNQSNRWMCHWTELHFQMIWCTFPISR